jgi:putative transposase
VAALLNEVAYASDIPDLFSRRVVESRIEHAENATLFTALFSDALGRHAVLPDQLTLNPDRGGPTKAKTTALIPASPGVVNPHSPSKSVISLS